MALVYLGSLTSIFGASAAVTGTGAAALLAFKPTETGAPGAPFNTPELAKPEAFLLALLQKAHAVQSVTAARAMEITKTSVLGTKDGQQVNGEQYIVRIFSGIAVTNLDPDTI
jgi:hypothetical protein